MERPEAMAWLDAWQVALTVRVPAVLARELAPLQAIRDHHRKTVLPLDLDPVSDHDGILVRPLLPFLLDTTA